MTFVFLLGLIIGAAAVGLAAMAANLKW